jgi:hypothetical protein
LVAVLWNIIWTSIDAGLKALAAKHMSKGIEKHDRRDDRWDLAGIASLDGLAPPFRPRPAPPVKDLPADADRTPMLNRVWEIVRPAPPAPGPTARPARRHARDWPQGAR